MYDLLGPDCGVLQVVMRPDIDQDECCLREWDFPVEVGIARVLFDPDYAFVNVPAVVTRGDGYFVHPSSLRSVDSLIRLFVYSSIRLVSPRPMVCVLFSPAIFTFACLELET